ncbi:MAG: bifunctional riboflavin kinase/FAD synthetase [Acidobacteriota bacterium]|nr:MAG: bifunctional riboflavin kinase/FAD synthetase [Acidobacteriota bacterium]
MEIFRDIDQVQGLKEPVLVAIGNFDGVHCGHQRVLGALVERARERGGTSLALTFYPHPMHVLALDRLQKMINTPEQRLELLEAQGLDAVVLVPFTKEFSKKSPLEFIDGVLGAMPVGEVHVGGDFRFGRRTEGDVALLRKEGKKRGFEVVCAPDLQHEGGKLGSSAIRRLLGKGSVEEAARLLGRNYFIDGRIIEGDKRGMRIGVPTANLRSYNEIIPSPGVYATRIRVGGVQHPGVTNVGFRPTFHLHGGLTIETHILPREPHAPFQRNIVGERVRIEFVAMLREERKFSSTEELRREILERDIPQAMEALKGLEKSLKE